MKRVATNIYSLVELLQCYGFHVENNIAAIEKVSDLL